MHMYNMYMHMYMHMYMCMCMCMEAHGHANETKNLPNNICSISPTHLQHLAGDAAAGKNTTTSIAPYTAVMAYPTVSFEQLFIHSDP